MYIKQASTTVLIGTLLLFLALAILTGCGQSGDKASPAPSAIVSSPDNGQHSPAPSSKASPPNETHTDDPIKTKINEMTLDEKIGQLFIVGLDGTTMDAEAAGMIKQYKVGGFILFKPNIENADQTLSLLNELKSQNDANPVPLWLSVDQEGGRVARLSPEFAKLPTAAAVGEMGSASYTYGIGQALGAQLSALGFNMNYAPVLDINSNPNNPVIGDRSFGTTPQAVKLHGMEMMKGINSQGVAAVAKHFPGHGDTSVDSHYDLPVVNKTLAQLKPFELIPFEEAISQGADAIMVAHLLMLELDKDFPSSISKKVIGGLLREELGYDGVVITDDLTMGGILDGYWIGEAVVAAVQAGSDLMLIGHDDNLQLEALNALRHAVESGKISEDRLDQSLHRILTLKQKYNLKDEPIQTIDVDAINKRVQNALEARP
ncbi:beta-N-acetylhexosaminidase [Paenibacillus sp. GCM10027627]|uniref:beta-N-acetylhexosaminidase n=1 Tax=unclassified Paenibacillus TaxID=185978 RepID=UPI00363F9104